MTALPATALPAAAPAPATASPVRLPDGATELLEGPWRSAFSTTVAGRVRSKANYRKERRGEWAEICAYEDEVASAVRLARPASWLAAASPDLDDFAVVAVLVGRTRLDAGNLSKSVLDACQGVIYADDAQVAGTCELVEHSTADQGVLIAFALVPDGVGTLGAMRTQAALLERVTALLEVPF